MTYCASAQCLYVLTDDNLPAIDEVRSNAAYSTCLLEIVRDEDAARGKDKEVIGDRSAMLKVLATGKGFFVRTK
jgi:hypothetical protein